MKLFSSLGQNIDGAPTNKAVQDAINGLVSHGTSSTGEYWKFACGLMICTSRKNLTISANSMAPFGKLYMKEGVILGAFPIPFVEVPVAFFELDAQTTGLYAISDGFTTTTEFGNCTIYRPEQLPFSKDFVVCGVAIGRWK